MMKTTKMKKKKKKKTPQTNTMTKNIRLKRKREKVIEIIGDGHLKWLPKTKFSIAFDIMLITI